MDSQLCQNDQPVTFLTNDRCLIQDLWYITSENSMDQNDEYFGWTNDLKIDDEKFSRSSNESVESKTPRKRKLSPILSDSLKIKTVNGFKTLKDPLSVLDSSEKHGLPKRSALINGRFFIFIFIFGNSAFFLNPLTTSMFKPILTY